VLCRFARWRDRDALAVLKHPVARSFGLRPNGRLPTRESFDASTHARADMRFVYFDGSRNRLAAIAATGEKRSSVKAPLRA
jgi:hypothetical protein